MSKAKIKVTVKPGKGGSGALLTSVPLSIEKNDHPNGKKMFQTKAQITIRPKTTRNGQPRRRRRS